MADRDHEIQGKIPEGITPEMVQEHAAKVRALLLDGIEAYLGGEFGKTLEARSDLFELGRFAISRIEALNLRYSKNSRDSLDGMLAALMLASILELLQGPALIDHPTILREQLMHHARRLLERSTTHVKESR